MFNTIIGYNGYITSTKMLGLSSVSSLVISSPFHSFLHFH